MLKLVELSDEELDALVCFCELYDGMDARLYELSIKLSERLADKRDEVKAA